MVETGLQDSYPPTLLFHQVKYCTVTLFRQYSYFQAYGLSTTRACSVLVADTAMFCMARVISSVSEGICVYRGEMYT